MGNSGRLRSEAMSAETELLEVNSWHIVESTLDLQRSLKTLEIPSKILITPSCLQKNPSEYQPLAKYRNIKKTAIFDKSAILNFLLYIHFKHFAASLNSIAISIFKIFLLS
jgi:hypothetical protein